MDKSSGLGFINHKFPAASLLGVEPLLQNIHSETRRIDATILAAVRQQSNLGTEAKDDLADATCVAEELSHNLHNEIRRVDVTILAAVRQQCNSGTKAKEDLADATRAAKELSHNYFQEIKSKSDKTEAMFHEICCDITKLDFAKKNITTVTTHLRRLTMIVSAVVQLQVMASKRQYKEAAAQLEAVNQLCNDFEANSDVPNITEVREKLKNIKQILKSYVFSDFSSLGIGKETEEPNFLKKLSDSCLVVDVLEPYVREELVNNFCSRDLTSYEQCFVGAELTNLDEIKWMYDSIKLRIRTNQEIWKIFPASWLVPYRLCIQFCKKTREQVEPILVNMKERPDVERLLLELERTLKFEKELEKKLGDGIPAKCIGDGIEHKFRGIISSCFEPYLTPYTEEEEKKLMQCLEKVVLEETWYTEEESQVNILSSSRELFFTIKNSYDRCKALTKNQTLFNLFKVFQRVLKAYATKLFFKLPKGGTRKQIKVSEIDERVICYIVTSAEYCRKTSGDLAEDVSTTIDPRYADSVDMSEVQNEFSSVITEALVTLVRGLETKYDTEMAKMTLVPWGTLKCVGDHSEYVNGIKNILNNSIPVLWKLLTPVYFWFFLDKLASSLGLRFYANIFRCKKISETGAHQMLLDTQGLEDFLLKVPSLDKQTAASAASYSKFVKHQMSRAEAVLKVILSPIDSVADTYLALFPEGNPTDLERILELKSLTKADKQSILDDFNNHGPRITQPWHATAMPQLPLAITNPAAGVAHSEDVLTRAATTGYTKFIDRPLRKLFIA